MKKFNLNKLEDVIDERIRSKEKSSYTYKLYKNPKLLNNKILEEAKELTKTKNKNQVKWEAADLLYFTLIFLSKRGVKLKEIEDKLGSRNKKRLLNKNELKKFKGLNNSREVEKWTSYLYASTTDSEAR